MDEQQPQQPTVAATAPPPAEPAAAAPARQPWQRPTLQRLHVSLDTAATKGSATDGMTGSIF